MVVLGKRSLLCTFELVLVQWYSSALLMDVSSVFPDKYLHELLAVGVRADGRGLHTGRPVAVSTGSISSCDGSAVVRCGRTLVSCGVKAELVAASTAPRHGVLVCNVECSSCCLPDYSSGPPSPEVQAITHQLQSLMEQVVGVDSLVVADSDLVWVLHVDAVCLSLDGNLLDTCCLAAVAALSTTVLSQVVVLDSVGPVLQPRSPVTSVPLKTSGLVTVTFALFDDWTLLDPALEEEQVAQGTCTVIVSLHPQEVKGCGHQGKVLSEEQLATLVGVASMRAASLHSLLQTTTSNKLV